MPADAADFAARRDATDEEARALASALRLRILRVCISEARTNKEIAQTLDKDPASTLHHVRRLVDTGFLAAQPARRGTRGAREIPYLATKKSWRINTPSKTNILLEVFLDEVGQVPIDTVQVSRLGLRLTPAEKAEFDRRIYGLFNEYAERSESPDGDAVSVFFALHPDPNRPD